MDDDILATSLDKLPPPPPMVQSRRPEAPLGNLGLGPAGPSAKERKEANPPSYAELLNKIDHSQTHPFQQQQQQQHQHVEYYEDEQQMPFDEHMPPPPPPPRAQKKKVRTEELTYAPPAQRQSGHAARETWWWKHKRALLVGCIVLLMLVYGIPKVQTLSPTFSTPITVYKLSHIGVATIAAASAGIYAAVTSYVI
jgi:hypothetical protein